MSDDGMFFPVQEKHQAGGQLFMDQPYRDYDRAFRLVLRKRSAWPTTTAGASDLEREENQ